MERVEVLIYQLGQYWVAETSSLNIAFVAGCREQAEAAIRAALRRCLDGPADIEVAVPRSRPMGSDPTETADAFRRRH
jgi:hypothetical protein